MKIDNYSRARPQWGLDSADAIIEENVEGVTRFVGLFHSNLPDRVGPVRSARTGDLDIFAGMNRPIVAWSGGNPGVTRWIRSAADSRVLVDFTAQRNPCYQRSSSRSAPHNLLLDPTCAVNTAFEPGPAKPLWPIQADWAPAPEVGAVPDTSFDVNMDGVRVTWTWNPEFEVYVRAQNGNPHLAVSGNQIVMDNVVEIYTAHPPSPVDAGSPNPITLGGGRAVIHRDGQAIEAVWGRTYPYDAFGFADAATGAPGVARHRQDVHRVGPPVSDADIGDGDSWDDVADGWDDDPAVIAYASAAHRLARGGARRPWTSASRPCGCSTSAAEPGCSPNASWPMAPYRSPRSTPPRRCSPCSTRRSSARAGATSTRSIGISSSGRPFDLIVASSVCSFLDDYPGTVADLASLLTVGGTFVQWDWELDPDGADAHGLSRAEIRDALEAAGLVDIHVDTAFRVAIEGAEMTPLVGIGSKSA